MNSEYASSGFLSGCHAAALIAAIRLLLAACGGSSGGDAPQPPSPNPPPNPPPNPATSGLDARPANLTCLAPPLAGATTDIELTRVFANLPLTQPLAMLQAPGDPDRWFVLRTARPHGPRAGRYRPASGA